MSDPHFAKCGLSGAVVSEALEEGMIVLGSRESGAAATILPPELQFSCRDVKGLAKLLEQLKNEFEPQISQMNADETSRVKEISENQCDQRLRKIARGSAEARGK